jgi:Cellulose binding domain
MGRLRRPRALEVLPWLPTVAGVVILVGLLVFALVSLRPDRRDRVLPPAPAGTPPFLAGPSVPDAPTTIAATPEATLNSPRRPSPSPSLSRSRPAGTPERRPPAPDLTGRYRTVQTFDGGFIGEVLVTNSSGAGRTWTVRLRFPPTIGPMRTFWVESAPQATLKQDGEVFAFTGSVPVGPRGSVALRFQFDRRTAATTPLTCSVNGTACASLPAG